MREVRVKRILVVVSAVMLFAIAILGLSSCAAKNRVTGVKNTFLEDVDISKKQKNLPFDHSWVNPRVVKEDFGSVYFKPVRVDLLDKEAWRRSAGAFITSEDDYIEKAKEVAEYFHSELVQKTGGVPRPKFVVVDAPRRDSVIIEIVLTELELSHPIARAGSLAIPVPGSGVAVAAVSDPYVAFAARVTEAQSGALLATIADRKFAPTRILDLNKFTVSSSAREICSLWADSIAVAIQSARFTEVSEKRFDWKIW